MSVITLEIDGVKANSVASAKMLGTPGSNITGFSFDPSKISPRILNRAVKYLESGYAIGGGQSVKLAINLSEMFDLKVQKIWSLHIQIPYELPLEDQERLKDIVTADHTAYLLTQRKSQKSSYYNSSHEHIKNVFDNNLFYIGDRNRAKATHAINPSTQQYVNGISFYTEDNLMQAITIVNKNNVDDVVKERRSKIVAALKKGEPWQVVLS